MNETEATAVTVPVGFNDLIKNTVKKAYGIEVSDAIKSPYPEDPVATPSLEQIRDLFNARINNYSEAAALLSDVDKILWKQEFHKVKAELGEEQDLVTLPDGGMDILFHNSNSSPQSKTQIDTWGRIV